MHQLGLFTASATRRYYLASSSRGEVRQPLAAFHYHSDISFVLCAHHSCDNIERKTQNLLAVVHLRRIVLTFYATGEGQHQSFHRFRERFEVFEILRIRWKISVVTDGIFMLLGIMAKSTRVIFTPDLLRKWCSEFGGGVGGTIDILLQDTGRKRTFYFDHEQVYVLDVMNSNGQRAFLPPQHVVDL